MKKLLLALFLLKWLIAIAVAIPVAAGAIDETSQVPRWQELLPPVKPPPRSSSAMAYDTARGVAVLFGGADSSTAALDDTWEWESESASWRERQPAHRPPARYGAAMVYDEAHGMTVLFGGAESPLNLYNDTWLWNGSDWVEVFPAIAPEPRWAIAAAYDPQRLVVVLFGGLGDEYYNDTWEWNNSDWVEQSIASPSKRAGAGMAYDADRQVMVLFGGTDFFRLLRDTWERSGSGPWQRIMTQRSPMRRERAGMVYFPPAGHILLYGGENFVFYDDTWLWDSQQWVTRSFDPRPAGRCCLAMVYDPVLEGVLLFGGSVSWTIEDDTWLFR